ncbi:MAG TPA: hypothetical protein VGY32_14185 [Solirubrobacteraceae bacterium]|nr:hypothetical protein [Solirubrobacteraceae bacterium]
MPFLVAALIAAGCGSSSSGGTGGGGPSTSAAATGGSAATTSGGGSGALSAEANSAATGDIPDNQVFLVFTNHPAGYSMKYPEGWTQSGAGPSVTFNDKNNRVRVLIASEPAPTPASLTRELQALKAATPSLTYQPPHTVQLPAGPAVTTTYTTLSAPNSVTGKRVLLIVKRYEIAKGGQRATVDLGTPQGVDNKDAYKLIINSFHWR